MSDDMSVTAKIPPSRSASTRRSIDSMTLTLQLEQETDGRWIAEIPDLPGTLVYGASPEEATAKAKALALRVLAERLEHGESRPQSISIAVAAA